jgi:arylsulfatase A-like enzyme
LNRSLAKSLGVRSRAAIAVVALTSASWAQVWTGQTPRDKGTTNVLVVVCDDVGVDLIGAWGASPDAAPTPTIDNLALNGVRFTRAYSQPLCSPTRATLMTGRYGFRTQIGALVPALDPTSFGLPLSEITFAEAVGVGGYTSIGTTAIGKWHMGSPATGGALHPNLQGFDWFSGTLDNFGTQTYYAHWKTVNGLQLPSHVYATTEQVDDALARVKEMPEPWCLYLAFNAPHAPLHVPPANLQSYTLSGPPINTPELHFRAALQALDTELGRMFASMDPEVLDNTTILLLGDNGTPGNIVTPPFDSTKAKGTVYEGGVHVPLIAWGKHVNDPGRVCDALINTVDVFATVIDLFHDQAELVLPKQLQVDGVSFMPYLVDPDQRALRKWVYSDHFAPNGPGPYTSFECMMRDERWKLIQRNGGPDEFYDIGSELFEGENLLTSQLGSEQMAAYAHLLGEMDELHSQ